MSDKHYQVISSDENDANTVKEKRHELAAQSPIPGGPNPFIQDVPTHGGPAIDSEAADENGYAEPTAEQQTSQPKSEISNAAVVLHPAPQPKALMNEEYEPHRRATPARSTTRQPSNFFKSRQMFNLETDFGYNNRKASPFGSYVAPELQPAHFFIALLILQVMAEKAMQPNYADQVFQQKNTHRQSTRSAQQKSDHEAAFLMIYQLSQLSSIFNKTGSAMINVDPQYTARRMGMSY